MKRFSAYIAVSLVCSLLLFCLPVSIAAPVNNTLTTPSEKITSALTEQYKLIQGAKTPVLVWLTDIDLGVTDTAALQSVGMTKDEWEDYSTAVASFPTSTRSLSTQENDLVQTYIEAKRAAAEKLYTTYNQQLAKKLFSESDIIYISRYSPVILANLSEDTAMTVAQSSDIERISYCGNNVDAIDLATNEVEEISLYDINSITRVNTIHNSSTYGYTGDGVAIGVLEISLPDTSQFSDLNILRTIDPDGYSSALTDLHANHVLEIISSIAPDAEYYLAACLYPESIMGVIEDLIACGVNIISASRSIGGSNALDFCKYGEIEQWLDHIAYRHDVHFIQGSGNDGAGPTFDANGNKIVGGPGSGAMAYNIITVGNLYVNGTPTYADDTIWTGDAPSSYYTGSTLSYKPDLCAPGEGIQTRFTGDGSWGGTSSAAPQVAGVVALLCEQNSYLKQLQNTVKAILTSSINFSSPHGYTPANANYRMYGAGLLDCVGACFVTGNYRFITSSFPSTAATQTHTFTVTGSDTRMRVSLAFNKQSIPNASHDSVTIGGNIDLNICVIDPTGAQVGTSATTNNNVEIVDFVPTMTGTYTVIISRPDYSSEPVYYGLAWR